MELASEWANSLAPDKRFFSLFEGDYLRHLIETLQIYADKGVKLFKFDFARFSAATEEGLRKYSREEIVHRNQQAFLQAMKKFRHRNPDVMLLPATVCVIDDHSSRVVINPPHGRNVQVFFSQCDPKDVPVRSWGGSPPDGTPMGEFLILSARQGKKEIPVRIEYSRMIWSGLSWAAEEIEAGLLNRRQPLEITCTAKDGESRHFHIEVYRVRYE